MFLIPRAGSSPSPDPPSGPSRIIPVAVVVGIVLILLVLGIVVFLVFLFCFVLHYNIFLSSNMWLVGTVIHC